jgi:hypothetical protein
MTENRRVDLLDDESAHHVTAGRIPIDGGLIGIAVDHAGIVKVALFQPMGDDCVRAPGNRGSGQFFGWPVVDADQRHDQSKAGHQQERREQAAAPLDRPPLPQRRRCSRRFVLGSSLFGHTDIDGHRTREESTICSAFRGVNMMRDRAAIARFAYGSSPGPPRPLSSKRARSLRRQPRLSGGSLSG